MHATPPTLPAVVRTGAAPMHGRLRLHVLASGSKGNCAIVESDQGLVMIDNGLSRKETRARMRELGLDEQLVRGVVVTHEHGDHTKGLGVWLRAFPAPLYASRGTLAARAATRDLAANEFDPGDQLELASMRITAFSTSHDVENPVGLLIEGQNDAVGFMTDTGIMPAEAGRLLRGVRILALESNHDPALLRHGTYPLSLQERIASAQGHLSNEQSAEAARQLVTGATEQLVAMHISQENNRPSLAVRALAAGLGAELVDQLGTAAVRTRADGSTLSIRPAGQNRPLTVA